jgi:hypothetical protein
VIATLQACERGQNKEKTAISFDSKNLTDITQISEGKIWVQKQAQKLRKIAKKRGKQRKTAVFCSNAKVPTALDRLFYLVQFLNLKKSY